MKIVGILGFSGSGKDTAATALIETGYVKYSFANALKDVIAIMFNWPRHLMEGDTKESREWRETVDAWWSKNLKIPNFTPRMAMTRVGTDVIRKHFSDNLWISNVENHIMLNQHDKIVITDCRYQNEAAMITRLGGDLIRIKKGPEPVFYQYSKNYYSIDQKIRSESASMMLGPYSHIHESEWAWNGILVDHTIENDSTIFDLRTKIIEVTK